MSQHVACSKEGVTILTTTALKTNGLACPAMEATAKASKQERDTFRRSVNESARIPIA